MSIYSVAVAPNDERKSIQSWRLAQDVVLKADGYDLIAK